MLAGCDTEDETKEFAFMGISSKVQNCVFGCDRKYAELKKSFDEIEPQYKECYIPVKAYKGAVKTLEQQKAWFQKNQLAYEEKIRVLERNLENTKNLLKFSEKEKAKIDLGKQELQVKFDKEVAGRKKCQEGSKHLENLINSSQYTRPRRALGYGDYIEPDEVYDPNEPSVFDPEPPLQFQNPVKYIKEGKCKLFLPPLQEPLCQPHYTWT